MNIWEVIMDSANETNAGVPTTTSVPNIQQYVRWSKKAIDIITNATNCLEQLITFSSVANQQEYTTPARFIRPTYVEWVQATQSIFQVHYDPSIAIFRKRQSFNFSSSIPPMNCTIWNKNLHIWPATSSSAQTTTIDGAHSATVTTITVAATTGFPSRGRAILNSLEVIEYTGTTSTTLTGVVRGVEGTTAATYSGTEAVAERDLKMYSAVRYLTREINVYNTLTLKSWTTTAIVGNTGTKWADSPNAYAGWEIGQGANPTKWYTIAAVLTDTTMTSTAATGETVTDGDSYVIASIIEIPVEFQDLITLYLISKTQKMLELRNESKDTLNEFYAKLNQTTIEMIDRTNIEYPHMEDTLNLDT